MSARHVVEYSGVMFNPIRTRLLNVALAKKSLFSRRSLEQSLMTQCACHFRVDVYNSICCSVLCDFFSLVLSWSTMQLWCFRKTLCQMFLDLCDTPSWLASWLVGRQSSFSEWILCELAAAGSSAALGSASRLPVSEKVLKGYSVLSSTSG